MRLFAVRGAVSVENNERTAILSSTRELIRELIGRNALNPDNFVSCIFTVTEDLDAEFPAVAARELGLGGIALLCAREIPVPGALAKIVRALIHYYAASDHQPHPVYLGRAKQLRQDLPEKAESRS